MTDKIQKIKDWISKTQDGLMDANSNFYNPGCEGAFHILSSLDYYINSMQEEPVSDDLEEASKNYALNNTPWDDCKDEIQESFKAGAKWQQEKDSIPAEYLEELINKLSKQFPEVSFAKLSRIAVRVAKWQKKQDQSTIELAEDHAMLASTEKMKEQMIKDIWKPADGEDLPIFDREVIALTQPYPLGENEYAVSFAHRPNPDGWDAKSIITEKVEHYTPETYDKGGWNQPNVKWWLDCSLPNMED